MKIRKGLALILALALVLSFFAALPVTASAEDSPVIALGTDKIATGNTVWFGSKSGSPVSWRVLSDGNDATLPVSQKSEALLITTEILQTMSFNPSKSDGNVWRGSAVQVFCDTLLNDLPNNDKERMAIKKTVTTESGYYQGGHNGEYTYDAASLDDFFFFLSAQEADTFFLSDEDRIVAGDGRTAWWWLRSPYTISTKDASGVVRDGWVWSTYVNIECGVRPAFNLNLSSVLFISGANGGKSDADGSLSKISAATNAEWKLTLKDSARAFSIDSTFITAPAGGTVSIPYTGALSGTDEYVSVLLCDDAGARYYGSVKSSSTSGTATFSLPKDITDGTYILRVFNEQKNADKFSDYASDFKEIKLIVGSGAYADSTGSYTLEDGSAVFVKPAKTNITSGNVPDTITVNGVALPVTKIAPSAFRGNQKKLTKVTIGKNVIEIGKNAFYGCKNLKTVSGGANVEVIGGCAFQGCTKLTKFTIGTKVKEIGRKAFYKCTALKKITIKSKLLTANTVGASAFKGIQSNATIKVPKAVKKEYTKWLLKKGVKKTMKIK